MPPGDRPLDFVEPERHPDETLAKARAQKLDVIIIDAAAALRPRDMATLSAAPPGPVMAMEFARCLIVSVTFAYFTNRLDIANMQDALILAVVAWGGIQAFGLIGSVLHEGYPPRLYAIHMGNALAKVMVDCLIITGLTSHFA